MLLGDGKGGFRLHRAGVWGERSTLGAALVHDLNADGPSMQYAMLVSRSLFYKTQCHPCMPVHPVYTGFHGHSLCRRFTLLQLCETKDCIILDPHIRILMSMRSEVS